MGAFEERAPIAGTLAYRTRMQPAEQWNNLGKLRAQISNLRNDVSVDVSGIVRLPILEPTDGDQTTQPIVRPKVVTYREVLVIHIVHPGPLSVPAVEYDVAIRSGLKRPTCQELSKLFAFCFA
jgi:hypothetical protein